MRVLLDEVIEAHPATNAGAYRMKRLDHDGFHVDEAMARFMENTTERDLYLEHEHQAMPRRVLVLDARIITYKRSNELALLLDVVSEAMFEKLGEIDGEEYVKFAKKHKLR